MIPTGDFKELERVMELNNWQIKWERFLPLHQRQILLLVSLTLQSFLTIPVILNFIDTIVTKCGYEILPRHERTFRQRYRRLHKEQDPELGEGDAFIMDESSIRSILQPQSRQSFRTTGSRTPTFSYESETNRMRNQNLRALGIDQ